METEPKRQGVGDLLNLAAPQKGRLILSGVFAVIGQGCGIVPYFIIYKIIAEIGSRPLGDVDERYIYSLVFAAGAAIVLKQGCLGISTALSHVAAYNILHDIRIKLAEKLKTLPLGYFNRKNTGQLKKVMSEDVEQMEIFLAHNIPDFIGAVVYMILTTLVLFVVDWRLALATVIVIPFGFVLQMMTMGQGREFFIGHSAFP